LKAKYLKVTLKYFTCGNLIFVWKSSFFVVEISNIII